ncbi:MAG TPA: AMP-binding protein, partial [bacterium]|nr:AMP-binding protein [bacterium]
AAGACVALPQRKGALGPHELVSFVRQHAVSLFLLPTAYWHAFMQSGGADLLKDSPNLRCIMVGGEAPAPRWVREWNRILPKTTFYNAYGPTEACVAVTLFECKPDETTDEAIPLGVPLPGVELAVVDPEGRLLPLGESGELWIAGACLADGYIGPRGLDRSRFAPAAPDGEEPRAFYRTGDRAVMDKRGRLLHQGRMDRQIKAAGVRMDLEEIESHLGRADGVSCAVVDASGSGDALALRAWVAATPGMHPDPQALKEWLKKSLPQACVPSDIKVLKAFPLNLSGKIDRQALLNLPAADGLVRPQAVVVPSKFSGVEDGMVDSLCAAFSGVLGRPVNPGDDFFALGGTSLRAVRLAGEASRRLERGVLVDQIYQAPTPKALAALLAAGSGPHSDQSVLRPLSQGPGPAWVLLPPSSGRLASYRGLGRLLEGRAQVWGFDLGRLPAPEAGDWNAWVDACVMALDAALPDAELVLGGWSMGGLLAADMARALVRRGRIVRRIVFIDVLVPDPLRSALALMDPFALESLLERDLEGGAPPEGGAAGSEEERRRFHLHVKATSGFTLAPLPVPLSVIISEHSSREEPRSSWMAWSLMARAGMTCLLVPGDHFSVLAEANLGRISGRLAEDVEAGQNGRLARV